MADKYYIQVSFLAGRMILDETTKKVSADKRRGKIHCYHDYQGEKHFKWINLETNKEEIDVYLFEGDAKFSKVQKSSGRVYYLSFESYGEKYFFWLQEQDQNKDEQILEKVNKVINYQEDQNEEYDIGEILDENVPQQQIQPPPLQQQQQQQQQQQPQQPQFFSGFNQGQQNAFQNAQQQQNLLQQFQMAFQQGLQNMQQFKRISPKLNDVLNHEYLDEALKNQEFQNSLIPLLPKEQQNIEGLRASLKSPQLQQAIQSLEAVLMQPEGATILQQLGINVQNSQQTLDGLENFLQALIQYGKNQQQQQEK